MPGALTLFQVAMLVGFAFLLSFGQILLKYVAISLKGENSDLLTLGIQVVLNPFAWAALGLYLCATVCWVLVLRSVPLTIAYPFAALGFVIVPVATYFLFHEPLTLKYGLGTASVIFGLYLISNS